MPKLSLEEFEVEVERFFGWVEERPRTKEEWLEALENWAREEGWRGRNGTERFKRKGYGL